ncbi:hypothetical protein [Streptomyces tauricus]|uniref:hypothetical protein n=1 Tax=Streptomyces tauricus TaxID=68274 RepID=UPI0033BF9D5C
MFANPVYVPYSECLIVEGMSIFDVPRPDDTQLFKLAPNQEVVVVETANGLRTVDAPRERTAEELVVPHHFASYQEDLIHALEARATVSGCYDWVSSEAVAYEVDSLATDTLALRRSERWNQALTTALLGDWCAPLLSDRFLPATALGALKAETYTLHRQLVPLWRRRTRHGRVLSLDATLGDGMTLYDLVAHDVDLLAHTTGGVFEDEHLNRVLRALTPVERAVAFAYAEGEGTTWTEAAAVAGATDPDAFGERVRRKTRRLAAEQHRRIAQRRTDPPVG